MTCNPLSPDSPSPTVCIGEILVEIVAATIGDGFLGAQPMIGPYPSGAGDCFGGAYIACRRLAMPPAKALTNGCAAGARNVAVRGPMEGAGTRAELDQFIATAPRRL